MWLNARIILDGLATVPTKARFHNLYMLYTFTTGAICIFDRSEQLLEKLRQSYEAEVDTLKRSQLELVDRNKVGVKTLQSGGNHLPGS